MYIILGQYSFPLLVSFTLYDPPEYFYFFCLLQGATVRNEGESIVVARIIKGGIADKTKLLKQGKS